MIRPGPQELRRRLSIASSLAELARVSPWISEWAEECEIPEATRFAMELCLEEALSNIVRHGYQSDPGNQITVEVVCKDRSAAFVVEDNAPPFEPREPADAVPASLDTIAPGGQGIRLLYRFASGVEYRRMPHGNRLTIRFENF